MIPHVNRAELLWKNWEDKQKELESITGISMDDRENLKLKYDFLRKGMYRISVDPSEREKLYLHAVRIITAKLEKQLYPTLFERLLHRMGLLVTKPRYLRKFEKLKQENLEELKADLKATGLNPFVRGLEAYLDYESPEVSIGILSRLDEHSGLKVIVNLERYKPSGYQFSGYNAILTDNQGNQKTVLFPKESQIDLKEATNLLQGRAVLKSYTDNNGTITKQWTQLNTNNGNLKIETFSPKIGYDLKQTLLDYSLQLDCYGINKEVIKEGLEQGNMVRFELNGTDKFHMQACPGERSLKFFDDKKQPLSFSVLKQYVNETIDDRSVEIPLINQNNIRQDKSLSVNM